MWGSVLLSLVVSAASALGIEFAKARGWFSVAQLPASTTPSTSGDDADAPTVAEVMEYVISGKKNALSPRIDTAVMLMRKAGGKEIVERNLRASDPVTRSIARVVLALPAFFWLPTGTQVDSEELREQLGDFLRMAPEDKRKDLVEQVVSKTSGVDDPDEPDPDHEHACGPDCECDDCSSNHQAASEEITSEMAGDGDEEEFIIDDDDGDDVGGPDDLDLDPETELAGPDYSADEDDEDGVSGPDYSADEDDEDGVSGPDYSADEDDEPLAAAGCMTGTCGAR